MKQYNGEKAVISLTSWKARIGTVAKTIYSLIKQCPGFHIVLVLSEEEFPQKESELPENLMLFVDNDLVEILWVYKNYKSFKKVLFTMDKYRDVPVISADDDCIYKYNYAEELYTKWYNNKNCIITESHLIHYKDLLIWGSGWGSIFPITFFNCVNLNKLDNIKASNDDLYYAMICRKFNIPIISLNKKHLTDVVYYLGYDKTSLSNTNGHNDKIDYIYYMENLL